MLPGSTICRRFLRLEGFSWWASIRSEYLCSAAHVRESKPDPPDGTPSGWSPPTGIPAPPLTTPTLPFRVLRSKNRNLPVYTDYKNGRSQILTLVRKIEGDVEVMEKMLRKHLKVKQLRSRVDGLTGTITFHGNHRDKIVKWLKLMGF